MPSYETIRIDPYRLRIPRQEGMHVDAIIYADERIHLEHDAIKQTIDAAKLPGVKKVIATPDIHVGYGVPIGCVVGLDGYIVPAAVGYDINCGMRLINTPLLAKDVDHVQLAHSFSRDIPLGEGKQNIRITGTDLRRVLNEGIKGYLKIEVPDMRLQEMRLPKEDEADMLRCEDNGSLEGDIDCVGKQAVERGRSQFASLGGGNHFIELQRVEAVYDEDAAEAFDLEEGRFVVMLHSGSRGFGHQVGGDYMKLATKINGEKSPTRHLSFLEVDSKEGQNYIKAMRAAANFAYVNRQIMAAYIRATLRYHYPGIGLPIIYDVPHNMAKPEVHDGLKIWVHRKGATRAFPPSKMKGTVYADIGQPVLIPGSMGTASYVLLGVESSAESMNSVNHGAGRVLSRSAAKGKRKRHKGGGSERIGGVSDEDFDRAMEGIHLICADRKSIYEEAPQAYKDIDAVIEIVAGAGLARPVARLKPLAVLKG
jgi:tRNA-splicing ligase RtcB